MPAIPQFSSQASYDGAPLPLASPNAAGLASRALADGLNQVSAQFAQVWQAQRQAQDAAQGLEKFAAWRNQVTDLEARYANDPDPGTVPQRFKSDLDTLSAEHLKGADGGVARYLQRMVTQAAPSAYAQVSGLATRRHNENLLGQIGAANDEQAKALGSAPNAAAEESAALAIKQGSAAAEASGLLPAGGAARLFSRGIATAITIRAATSPVAAQALLDRYRGEMTADDVARIATGLRAPLERAQGEAAATRAIALSGDPVTDLTRAIFAQESGSGANPATSVNGARGGMQILPQTFAQYARPGENIDNPADNQAVGQRIVADLYARAGGDPARVAVGYFSGPGNIAPPGSPTPWIADKADGNGQTTSRYVGQVLARLGTARDRAIGTVRAELKDAPLHVRLSAESQVAEHFAHQEAALQQERATLRQHVADLSAAYEAGRTEAPIPEADIRRLEPPDQAQRTLDSLAISRTAGDAFRAVAYASPAEEAAMRANLAPQSGQDVALAGQREQMLGHFDAAVARKRKALRDDPAGFAAGAPELAPLIQAARENDPAAVQALARNMLAVQQRLGVPEYARRVLPDAQLAGMVNQLASTDPAKADMGAVLAAQQQTFGPLWPQVAGELVRHGSLAPAWQAMISMPPEHRADLQRALVVQAQKGGKERLREEAGAEAKNVAPALNDAMAPFRAVSRYSQGGLEFSNAIRDATETLALYRAFQGQSASAAVESAFKDIIGRRWDFAGDDGHGTFGGSPTMLVPKGMAAKVEAATAGVQDQLQPGDLAALPGSTGSQAERLAQTLAAAKRGIWVTNPDASGAILLARGIGGQVLDLRRADGSPIEIRYDALPAAIGAARMHDPMGTNP